LRDSTSAFDTPPPCEWILALKAFSSPTFDASVPFELANKSSTKAEFRSRRFYIISIKFKFTTIQTNIQHTITASSHLKEFHEKQMPYKNP
jgi:hypothetical protein